MRYVMQLSIGLLALATSAPALAWDGAKTGKITGIDVTDGQNLGFRVLMAGTSMCGTAADFAYMNRDWDNYDATAAVLTSAFLADRTVLIYTTKVGDYCRIGYVVLR